MSTEIPVDIETTGKYPIKDEVISVVTGGFALIQSKDISEVHLLNLLKDYVEELDKDRTTFITFRGGTLYSSTFDWGFLRVRFLKNSIPWPFNGFDHIDVYPLIQKWLLLDFEEVGKLKDLSAADLKKFAIHFGIKPESTIPKNIETITELLDEEDINKHLWELGVMKVKSHNNLKDAAFYLCGIEDDGMRGKDVPPLFKKWKETGDDEIIKQILKYNKADCYKTLELFRAVKPLIPWVGLRSEKL